MTLRELLDKAIEKLHDSTSARLDAEVLLAHALGKARSYLYAWPDKELDDQTIASFNALLAERLDGKPIAYLTGQREFWSMHFKVNEHVLIPRPETELLVETVLNTLPNTPQTIADFGTGSGAIACAIAKERPTWTVHGVEQSESALHIAEENRLANHLSNIEWHHSDWGQLIDFKLDAIVTNPPYIAENDAHLLQGDVAFEPRSALAAGPRGLDDIDTIIQQSVDLLKEGAWLFIEHGYDQAEAVLSLLAANGFKEAQCLKDMNQHDRVSFAQKF